MSGKPAKDNLTIEIHFQEDLDLDDDDFGQEEEEKENLRDPLGINNEEKENCNTCLNVFNAKLCQVACIICRDLIKNEEELFQHFQLKHDMDLTDLNDINEYESEENSKLINSKFEKGSRLKRNKTKTSSSCDEEPWAKQLRRGNVEMKVHPNVCRLCYLLVEDMETHKKEDHLCKLCNLEFKSLKHHRCQKNRNAMEEVNKEESDKNSKLSYSVKPIPNQTKASSSWVNPNVCQLCYLVFKDVDAHKKKTHLCQRCHCEFKDLKRHWCQKKNKHVMDLNEVHKDESNDNSKLNNSKVGEDSMCSKTKAFSNCDEETGAKRLQRNVEMNANPKKCSLCFLLVEDMDTHKKKDHMCKLCNLEFYNLRVHKETCPFKHASDFNLDSTLDEVQEEEFDENSKLSNFRRKRNKTKASSSCNEEPGAKQLRRCDVEIKVHPNVCRLCSLFVEDMDTHRKEDHLCKLCNLEFKNLKRHGCPKKKRTSDFESDENHTLCKLCDFMVKDMDAHNQEKHLCKGCHNEFTNLKLHQGSCRNYKCQKCDAHFYTQVTLETHVYEYHNVDITFKTPKISTSTNKNKAPNSVGWKTVCGSCGKLFYGSAMFNSHCAMKHAKDLSCSKCDVSFNRLSDIVDHYSNFHGPKGYKCNICSETFSLIADMKGHIEINHSQTFNEKVDCTELENEINVEKKEEPQEASSSSSETEKVQPLNYHCSKRYTKKEYRKAIVILKTETYITMKGATPELLQCSQCNYHGNNEDQIFSHYSIKHPDIVIKGLKKALSKLETFVTVKGTTQDLMKCTQCDFTGYNEDLILSHYEIKHPEILIKGLGVTLKCYHENCSFVCQGEESMKFHFQYKHKEFNKCETCNLFFKNPSEYASHMSENHIGKFKCEDCGVTFSTYEKLQKHIQKKGMPGNFSCIYCDMKFNYENRMNNHYFETHHHRLVKCFLCSKLVETKELVMEHLKKDHNEPLKNCYKLLDDFEVKNSKYRNDCQNTWCKYVNTNPEELRNHQKIEHGYDLECLICEVEYGNLKVFAEHIRQMHKGKFRCNRCGMVFDEFRPLTVHIKRELSKNEFVCDVCGFKTKALGNLRNHKRYHAEKQKCEECDYATPFPKKLQDHVQCKHRGGLPKKYSCHICGKSFAWATNFTNHLTKRHKFFRKKKPEPLENLIDDSK